MERNRNQMILMINIDVKLNRIDLKGTEIICTYKANLSV